ncbi:MAG: hypothetical protein ACT443_11685 [Gemmatimonadota bacterium]
MRENLVGRDRDRPDLLRRAMEDANVSGRERRLVEQLLHPLPRGRDAGGHARTALR